MRQLETKQNKAAVSFRLDLYYLGLISRDAKGNVGFTYSIVASNLH